MSLYAQNGTDTETGVKSQSTKPIEAGVSTMVTSQPANSTGFFGFLDDLGTQATDFFGKAVNAVGDNYIDGLKDKNSDAVKTPDVTPTPSESKLPVNQSFFEANKTYIMYGGIAVIGVTALILAFKK